MNSRSASIVGDQEAAGSSSFAWCNRQWLSSQALTRRSSVRPKQAVFNHNLLWLPESNGYPLTPILSGDGLTRQGVLFPRENGGSNPSSPLQPPHGIGAGSELDWERLTLPFTESSELLQIDQRCLPLPDHLD